jgi:hypothetical protein
MPKFITISTMPDAWGDTAAAPDFSQLRESMKLTAAAEASDIEVYVDCKNYNSADPDQAEIDWFSTWCREGFLWDESRWVEWFSSFKREGVT